MDGEIKAVPLQWVCHGTKVNHWEYTHPYDIELTVFLVQETRPIFS